MEINSRGSELIFRFVTSNVMVNIVRSTLKIVVVHMNFMDYLIKLTAQFIYFDKMW